MSLPCIFLSTINFRLEDMKDQLKKRMFKKRIVRRFKFSITNKLSIAVNSYALIRPTLPGTNILIYFSWNICFCTFVALILDITFLVFIYRSNHLAWFNHKSSIEGNNILFKFHCSGCTGSSWLYYTVFIMPQDKRIHRKASRWLLRMNQI